MKNRIRATKKVSINWIECLSDFEKFKVAFIIDELQRLILMDLIKLA